MALFTFVSAKGAPGTSTTVLGLAFQWPRPCLIIEADPAGGSSFLAGWLRGEVRHDRGLIDLVDYHREGTLHEGLYRSSISLREASADQRSSEVRLLSGINTPAQIGPVSALWDQIAIALTSLEHTGVDVLVDAGRAGAIGAPTPILRRSDLVMLVSRSDLPSVAAAKMRVRALTTADPTRSGAVLDVDAQHMRLLLVGPGRPFSAREIAPRLGINTVCEIGWNPAGAEVYSHGAPRSRKASAIDRDYQAGAAAIGRHLEDMRTRLDRGRLVSNP